METKMTYDEILEKIMNDLGYESVNDQKMWDMLNGAWCDICCVEGTVEWADFTIEEFVKNWYYTQDYQDLVESYNETVAHMEQMR